MNDPLAKRMYRTEVDKARADARRAIEYASRALQDLQTTDLPSPLGRAAARRLTVEAAEITAYLWRLSGLLEVGELFAEAPDAAEVDL